MRSDVLGVDYTEVQAAEIAPPQIPVIQDLTPPETASVVSAVRADGKVKAVLEGFDAQSGILYYDYSLDGGATWSSLKRWESAQRQNTVTLTGSGSTLTVRLYNGYDLATQSNTVTIA